MKNIDTNRSALAIFLATVLSAALMMTASLSALAKTDPVYTGFFSSLAVSGYDVVAYFTEGRAVEGDANFSVDYLDTEWRFSSADNLQAFNTDREKYLPQYGGYCAWAVSHGNTVKGNPHNWRIVEGKLYLNYDDDVQETWESDIPGFISRADKNWPELLAK